MVHTTLVDGESSDDDIFTISHDDRLIETLRVDLTNDRALSSPIKELTAETTQQFAVESFRLSRPFSRSNQTKRQSILCYIYTIELKTRFRRLLMFMFDMFSIITY